MKSRIVVGVLVMLSGCAVWYGKNYFPSWQLKQVMDAESAKEPLAGHLTSAFAPAADREVATASNGGFPLEYLGVDNGRMCFLTTGWGTVRNGAEGGELHERRLVEASFEEYTFVFQWRANLDELSLESARWPKNSPNQVDSIGAEIRSEKRVRSVLGIRGENDPGKKIIYDVKLCGAAPVMDASAKYLTVVRMSHEIGVEPSLFVWVVAPASTASPSTTPATTEAPTPAAAPKSATDLRGVLTKDGRFTTFLKAISQAGLEDALTGRDRLTVFAPTDEAFTALGKARLDALLADGPRLKDVLQDHLISGPFPRNQFTGSTTAHPKNLSALNGKTVRVRVDKTGHVLVEGNRVSTADVHADNGVIHVIDGVIEL